VKYRHLRVHYADRRLSVSHDGRERAAEQIVTDEVVSQKG
jgi:hypothetical protein